MSKENILLKEINKSAKTLHHHGIENGRQEIIWYLDILNIVNKNKIYTYFESQISPKIKQAINIFIKERSNSKPFQYIVNQGTFYGRTFYVNSQVLIPRPETEIILDILKDKHYANALEIGTGSGVISVTLSLENIAQSILATDISTGALNVAKKNILKFSCKNIKFQLLKIIH